MARSRNYSFTLNNYTDEELENLKKLTGIKYMILGDEVGESGTPHIQGYCSWNSAKSFTATKKLLGNRIHLEVSKGTPFDNYVYCSKESILYETGDRPKKVAQGERKDLQAIKKGIKNGTKIRKLIDDDHINNLQQLKYAESLNKYYEKKRKFKPTVKWYYGATGTGKTKTAYEEMEALTDDDNIYTAMDTGKWWDGYDGQEYIIIDDMRSDFLKFHQLIKLIDRNEYRVETKGSTRQFLGKYIIITSAYPPDKLFHTEEDPGQLTRRLDEIKEFKSSKSEIYNI